MNRILLMYILLPIIVFCLFFQCKNKNQNVIEMYASEINKQCPIELNAQTTMIKAEVLNDYTLVFNYITDSNIEALNTSENFNFIKNSDLYNITHNESLRPIKDANATIIYKYWNKTDSLILELKYTPFDYYNYKVEEDTINNFAFLEQTVNTYQNTLPTYITENICITKMRAVKPAILEYQVQITNVSLLEAELVLHKSIFITAIKQDGGLAKHRSKDITFRYRIFDKDNRFFDEIEITPEDYK